MRSAARGSACAEAEIAVDHADQREPREVMALGDELGADDDIDLALLDLAQGLAELGDVRREIARQQHAARIGKKLGDLLGDALDARPARRRANSRPRNSGSLSGIGTNLPQWWHSRRRRNLCSTSQAEQFGHSNLKPHFRQSVTGA